MDLNTYMGYRVTEQEIAQAAVRAERARVAAEHRDQVVPRIGIVRRALTALTSHRVPTDAARAARERVGNASDRTPHPA